MFGVEMSAEARDSLLSEAAALKVQSPVVMIAHVTSIAENWREPNGDTAWMIRRYPPIGYQVADPSAVRTNERLISVRGMSVYVGVDPQGSEKRLLITLQAGKVHIEAAA